jgi:hypothetical protein
MLKAIGTDWVFLERSDRRNNLGEINELISDKVKKARRHRLKLAWLFASRVRVAFVPSTLTQSISYLSR